MTNRKGPGFDLIDAIHANVAQMQSFRHQILRLANAFEITGNEKVADELADIADGLVTSAQRVQEAHSGYQQSELSRNQANIAGILTTLVKGVEIGKGIPK